MLHTQEEANKLICKHREKENMFSAEYSEKFTMCDTHACSFSWSLASQRGVNLFTNCSSHHWNVVMEKKHFDCDSLAQFRQLRLCFSIVSIHTGSSKICFPCLSFNHIHLVPPPLRPIARFPLIWIYSKFSVLCNQEPDAVLFFTYSYTNSKHWTDVMLLPIKLK